MLYKTAIILGSFAGLVFLILASLVAINQSPGAGLPYIMLAFLILIGSGVVALLDKAQSKTA